MSTSTYFRFLSQGKCCPCSPPSVVCNYGQEDKGNNWVATKQIQFGGTSILPGGACGQGTGVCDGKLNVPIVVDSFVSGDFPPNCEWRYNFDDSDANCQSQIMRLALEDRGLNLARWRLDYLVNNITEFSWLGPDLATPVNISTWTGALAGTYNNYVFGIPPGPFCAFDDVTASVVA